VISVTDFKVAYEACKEVIEGRYSVKVHVADVVDPNTGDLDGQNIVLDYLLDQNLGLFVLLHLFGHTVQWNTSETLRKIGLDLTPGKTEADLPPIYEYECNATRYGLTLLHQAEIDDLDRWATDWFYADWKFLKAFYLRGEKLDSRTLIEPGVGELLTELPIPKFTTKRYSTRFAF
jgi:hypothetical protein